MRHSQTRPVNGLLSLPRSVKNALAVLTDSALCVLSVWLAVFISHESWIIRAGYRLLAIGTSIVLAILLLNEFGCYHAVTR